MLHGGVLRRLLLLFALLLALPATARPACHDAGAMQGVAASGHGVRMDHAGGHHDARDTGHAAHASGHDCLGCIPPDMLLGARVARAIVPRATIEDAAPPRFAAGLASAPTPPPPKTA